jgi:hypothetical protein
MSKEIELTGPSEEIELILALAREHSDVEDVSEPMSLDASEALNVGLPHAHEIQAALSFLTVVFKTGTAGFAFFKALRELLKARDGAVVVVSESATKHLRGRIDSATSDRALVDLAPSA